MFCYKMYKFGLIKEKLGSLITKQRRKNFDPVLTYLSFRESYLLHDDVIKWKDFPRYWPFLWGIHRSTMNSPHKGRWRGALVFSLICAWTNGSVNNLETGDLRCHRTHYDVTVMLNLGWLCKVSCGGHHQYGGNANMGSAFRVPTALDRSYWYIIQQSKWVDVRWFSWKRP